jgi:hypothetical protein
VIRKLGSYLHFIAMPVACEVASGASMPYVSKSSLYILQAVADVILTPSGAVFDAMAELAKHGKPKRHPPRWRLDERAIDVS